MIKTLTVSGSSAKQWNDMGGAVYHSIEWARVVEKTFSFPVKLLVNYSDSGIPLAVLPIAFTRCLFSGNRISSLPCAYRCGPIGDPLGVDELVSYSRSLLSDKCAELELRCEIKLPGGTEGAFSCFTQYVTHVLDLACGESVVWRNFHKSCIQRAIKKAEKADVGIIEDIDEGNLRKFYHLYLISRRQNGLLPLPYSFFNAMREFLAPIGCFHLILGEHRGKIVSGILLVSDGTTMVYEYGATLNDYYHLGVSPLLIWHAIQKALRLGLCYFDFGRSSVDNKNLRLFKARWGAAEKTLYYYYHHIHSQPSSVRTSKLAGTLMNIVIRSSPLWLCRLLGSVLYRHLV